MYIVLTIIIAIVSIIVILAVLFQQSKSYGLSSSIGGGEGPQSYWTKNKNRSKEGKLKRITIIAGIVFFVAAILLNVSVITGFNFEFASAAEEETDAEEDDEEEEETDSEEEEETDSEDETDSEEEEETDSEEETNSEEDSDSDEETDESETDEE